MMIDLLQVVDLSVNYFKSIWVLCKYVNLLVYLGIYRFRTYIVGWSVKIQGAWSDIVVC